MFDKHALKKKRDIRSNLKPFINNEISKAITTRDLKTIFCKHRSKGVSLLRKPKIDYFTNLNEKNITDNKRYWKTMKPYLSKKINLPE